MEEKVDRGGTFSRPVAGRLSSLPIDMKFMYPNNPDGWWLSGMWGKLCVW